MRRLRYALAGFFTFTGTMHFVQPKVFEAIVPPYVPFAHEAVLISGAAEIAGGLALLPERSRIPARWWLIALLVAVFPANVHMAVSPDQVQGLPQTTFVKLILWLRLPLQPLLIWLVWRASEPEPGRLAALQRR